MQCSSFRESIELEKVGKKAINNENERRKVKERKKERINIVFRLKKKKKLNIELIDSPAV